MKHNELRDLKEERLDSVKSGITRKGFFKEIDNVAKEVGGKLTDADIAVISEIHKDLNDYRFQDLTVQGMRESNTLVKTENAVFMRVLRLFL